MAIDLIHKNNDLYFGLELHTKISAELRFAELIFWLLSERRPKAKELIIFELILNLSIDHGAETPSAKKTIVSAQAGFTISESVAAGLKEINVTHGGAQELCMPLLYQLAREEKTAAEIVKEHLLKKARLPGFGHRLYVGVDSRAELIILGLKKQNLGSEFVLAARALGSELARQTGKDLPLNIDGAIAVALCAFGWSAALGQAVFIVARTPGLCGQYLNVAKTIKLGNE